MFFVGKEKLLGKSFPFPTPFLSKASIPKNGLLYGEVIFPLVCFNDKAVIYANVRKK